MGKIFFAIFVLFAGVAHAAADEAKVSLSMSLIEEIFRSLSAQPYANVAGTIAKLQTEIQQQASVPPHPPVPPPEKK